MFIICVKLLLLLLDRKSLLLVIFSPTDVAWTKLLYDIYIKPCIFYISAEIWILHGYLPCTISSSGRRIIEAEHSFSLSLCAWERECVCECVGVYLCVKDCICVRTRPCLPTCPRVCKKENAKSTQHATKMYFNV